MRTRVESGVDEARKTAKRTLAGSKSRDKTASETKLEEDLASVQRPWKDAEPRYRTVGSKRPGTS